MKTLLVALQDVELHSELRATIAEYAENLPDRYASTELSPEGVEHLCLAFPIRTVRTKLPSRSKGGSRYVYHCVGGLRTYQIAKARLPPETRVRVLVDDETGDEVGPRALRELFLGAVAFGIRGSRSAAQLEALRKMLPVDFLTQFFPRIKSRTAMTRVFGFGRSALSPRKDESDPETK